MKYRIVIAALAAPLAVLGTAGAASAAQVKSYGSPAWLHATKATTTLVQVQWSFRPHVRFLAQARDGGRVVNQFLTWNHYANFGGLRPGRAYQVTIRVNAAGARPGTITVRTARSFNQRVAAYATTLEGAPYRYGGTTPRGFDCSGLTQYAYGHNGKRISRTAQQQYNQFRRISHAAAQPGDLVFFHSTSSPRSYVYHVGVYEGGQHMVAAPSSGRRVSWQSFTWAGNTVTFGTVSH